jgi:hypothetical protein
MLKKLTYSENKVMNKTISFFMEIGGVEYKRNDIFEEALSHYQKSLR